jgi:hypothetical protein
MLYVVSGFAVFVFLFTYVKPELTYHLQQLGFSTSKTFFIEMAGYPGGIAEYISILLFQFSYSSYFGSIVNAVLFFVLLFLSDRLFHRRRSAIDTFLLFCPPIIVVMLMLDYTSHPVFPVLAILLFLFFKFAMKSLGRRVHKVIRFGLLTIFLAAFYYIAGGFLFLVLCLSLLIWMLFSLKIKKDFPEILYVILVAYVIPKFAPYVFFITEKDAFLHFVPYFCNYKPDILLYASVLSLPAILVLQLPLRFRLENLGIKKSFLKSEWFQLIQTFMMIGVLVYSLFYNFEEKGLLQHKIQIDKLAHERKWDEVLKLAKNHPFNDRVTQFHVNRALYFTGTMSDSLFTFPQSWGLDGLFLTRYFSEDMLLPSTELFFDLAYINEAIHYGNEAIAQNENSPLVIEQLILANIASDKMEAARLYVNVFKDFPVYRQKAFEYEKYLDGEGYTEIDSVIIQKRKLRPFTDFRVTRQKPSEDLLNILLDRQQNRMAYEYLMACFLLENDLASFMKYYTLGRKLNYDKVPSLYQQAILLYSYELSRSRGRALGNLRFDKSVVNEFKQYLSIFEKNNGDLEAAKPELELLFGNTYWFYVHYNSPVTNAKKE